MKYTLISILCIFFTLSTQAEVALFSYFPQLKDTIPHIALCDLPTPVVKLESLGNKIGYTNLYCKRDDLSGTQQEIGKLYGGNKPRKLEWILADVIAQKKNTIVTYGCVGSNHARATATYAHELGLHAILLLRPQPNSDTVRLNLLCDYALGAELHLFATLADRDAARTEIMNNNSEAYFIPTGGSNAIGTLGYVNAAFELQQQIEAGIVPEPDIIYIPIGSCATAAGLVLGMALLKSKTKIIAVATEPEGKDGAFEQKTKLLFEQANQLLHNADPSIAVVEFPTNSLVINKKFCGTRYGLWTQEGTFVQQHIKELEGITLDGTYSAKPINAFIDDVSRNQISNEVVLLWNTYCGIDCTNNLEIPSYKELPQEFHRYFEQQVQPLNALIAKPTS